MKKAIAESAGAGLLLICLDDNTVLLVKRSESVSEPGTWGVPGGHIESGETPAKAVKRETIEELGTFPRQIRPIQAISNKSPRGEFILFTAEISKEEKELWTSQIKLNDEHDAFHWFPIGNLPKHLHSAIEFTRT